MMGKLTKILGKDEILQAEDEQQETVEVPEWGGSVILRGMTGKERDAWEQKQIERKRGSKRRSVNTANFRARLVAACVVDEKGERVFADADAQALGTKSAAGLSKVFDVAARLSGITEEDQDELDDDFPEGDGTD